jgi:two-component system nitrogen regulation response regulator GlnG/two-component system response regulator HydG
VPASSTLTEQELPWELPPAGDSGRLELVVAWSLDEPDRVGESAHVDGARILGRGAEDGEKDRLRFRRWRPGQAGTAVALQSPRISRDQLRVRAEGDRLCVENVGRCKLRINGEERDAGEAHPGDTLTLKNAAVLVVARRVPLAGLAGVLPPADFAFGGPDAYGIIGESAPAWRLRAELAFAAASAHHVLLTGPSGVGKELAARALHGMSARGRRPLVARNAATLPESLVDAELFGSARNYPNVGSPERPGLVGEADGSSLFLDEIGELPPALQAHLLRVLDAGGEYQRLGEARSRRSDLRVIAATNRDPEALKHDFLARLTTRVRLPGLDERPDDVPLLLAAALRRAAAETPAVFARFFGADGRPRVHPDLVEALVRHRYTLHVRELHRLLWRAVSTSPADHLAFTPEVRDELSLSPAAAAVPPDRAAIEAALAAAGGRAALAAEALGLRSRYALYRLMKKHGIGADVPGE